MPLQATREDNLFEYPQPTPCHKHEQRTIGDLHGNALKLIYFLVKQGVLVMSPLHYQALVEIYQKPKLSRRDLEQYDAILASMTVNPVGRVRLIGDEFADRGKNDYLTLKVLLMLRVHEVPVEIMLSNHSLEFIEAYEKGDHFLPTMLSPQHAGSLFALNDLIKSGLVSKEEVLQMVEVAYKPSLKALSYTLSDNGDAISIYTHAPVGLEAVEALAKKFDVLYDDQTAAALAGTINRINETFQKAVENNTIHKLYSNSNLDAAYRNPYYNSADDPFTHITWNRDRSNLDRPSEMNGYSLHFVHGHDASPSYDNIANLDTLFGRPRENAGKCEVYSCSGQSPQLLMSTFTDLNIDNETDAFKQLHASIIAMRTYGETTAKDDYTKSGIAILLANNLLTKLTSFSTCSAQDFPKLKDEFLELLHSKDKLMNKHRSAWKPILLNIAIALTGVGLLVIGGKLIQSKITTGHFMFFAEETKQRRFITNIEKNTKRLSVVRGV